MKYVILLTGCLISSVISGCNTYYVDTETPAGSVPPAPIQSLEPSINQNGYTRTANTTRDGVISSNKYDDNRTRVDFSSGTIERFQDIYNKKDKPRIAVFLNRQLSDEVREWKTSTRKVATGGKTTITEKDAWDKKTTEATGDTSTYSQTHLENNTARPEPGEKWMWSFEDGFIRTFLSAKAKLIDRTTILRLSASKSGKQGDAHNLMAVKKIEMDALSDHADIFVEILISRSPSSLYGYEFKATAKEVKTGAIIANTTSLRWKPEKRVEREIIATSDGYEVLDSVRIPPVYEVSEDLALDLMNAFVRLWEK